MSQLYNLAAKFAGGGSGNPPGNIFANLDGLSFLSANPNSGGVPTPTVVYEDDFSTDRSQGNGYYNFQGEQEPVYANGGPSGWGTRILECRSDVNGSGSGNRSEISFLGNTNFFQGSTEFRFGKRLAWRQLFKLYPPVGGASQVPRFQVNQVHSGVNANPGTAPTLALQHETAIDEWAIRRDGIDGNFDPVLPNVPVPSDSYNKWCWMYWEAYFNHGGRDDNDQVGVPVNGWLPGWYRFFLTIGTETQAPPLPKYNGTSIYQAGVNDIIADYNGYVGIKQAGFPDSDSVLGYPKAGAYFRTRSGAGEIALDLAYVNIQNEVFLSYDKVT